MDPKSSNKKLSPSKRQRSPAQQQEHDHDAEGRRSILVAASASPRSDYYITCEEDIHESVHTPPPLVGPPSDESYSDSFIEMVTRIRNKYRHSFSSPQDHQEEEAENEQQSPQERNQSAQEQEINVNDTRSCSREIDFGRTGVQKEQEQHNSSGNNSWYEAVEEARGDRGRESSNDDINPPPLELPPLDAYDDDPSFNEMLHRILNQYPRSSLPRLTSEQPPESSGNPILDLQNDPIAGGDTVVPSTSYYGDNDEQRVEQPRRLSVTAQQQFVEEDPLLLENYSVLDNHPWLQHTDPQREEFAYIARNPLSVNDFEYIPYTEWLAQEASASAEQEECSLHSTISRQAKLAVFPRFSSHGGGGSPSSRQGNSVGSRSKNREQKKKASSSSITAAADENTHDKAQNDFTWSNEDDFTHWLSFDSDNELKEFKVNTSITSLS
jgi:hypothetical protein